MVDICMLGTGGGMPMPFRYLSSSILNYKGRKILIDCGEGTQVSMRIAGTGFKSIDVILITHFHGDHIVGLPGLLSTIGNSGREEDLTIVGPEGIKNVIESLSVLCPFLPYKINIIENPKNISFSIDGILRVSSNDGEINLNALKLDHSSECLGYSLYFKRNREFLIDKAKENNVPQKLWKELQKGLDVEFDNILYTPSMVLGEERKGIKISYITDTRPIDSIIDFVYESDIFICEGTYGDDEDIEKAIKNKHMTFREASKLANKSKVKELIITHFSPAMINPEEYINNANTEFENVKIAFDRQKTQVKYR